MKNAIEITKQIAKQTKLVNKLKKAQKEAYDNLADNMLTSQAEFFIARAVLDALKNTLSVITNYQETLDYYNN
jgi:chemotaxis methyl-accepting protein methylase